MVRQRRRSVPALAVLITALIALLAVPAIASAVTYQVDNTGDGSTKALCEAHITNECTLRGAIEAANSTSEADTIHFSSAEFNGATPGSTIVLGSELPTITEPVEIDAGECTSPIYGVAGPCAQVDGATGKNVFTVKARLSSIKGLAIEGGENGIVLGTGTELFFAARDWFGVRLDGFPGGGSVNAGVLIEPGAKNAVIGGETAAVRNVFEASPTGVEIIGASENQVQGNYIGLDPEGKFQFGRSLGVGVSIVDSTAPVAKAEFNEIGGARESGSKSEECSGGCNAFATESAPGVGVAVGSATGPTTVSGNYFGLRPDGSGPSESRSNDGVLAEPSGPGKPGPGGVTIGGPTSATEGNLFVEGRNGVKAVGAKALEVVGNKFGYTSGGKEIEDGRAQENAISVSSEGLAAGATIESNSISAESSGGIESLFAGSKIVGNDIVGGAPAIFTGSDAGEIGNGITANTITKAVTSAIALENSGNVVSGNTITRPGHYGIDVEGIGHGPGEETESNVVIDNSISEAVEIGIQIGSNATHNRVGGDEPGEANMITKSGGAGEPDGAITIVSRQEGRNEVAANTGFGNSPGFIKLISHGGHEEPNGGIKPPAIATVLQSTATGTAQPNATVRIFSKASPETGELGALLKVVKADALGSWSATYGAVPVGTLVAATQTDTEGATSELTTAVAASADPSPPEQPQTSPQPSPPVTQIMAPAKAPKVTITKGPKKSSTSTTAKFKFKAEPAAGAKFECKLDGGKWAGCGSPKTYKKLKVGKHTFQVRATASGLTGAATKFKFTVKT